MNRRPSQRRVSTCSTLVLKRATAFSFIILHSLMEALGHDHPTPHSDQSEYEPPSFPVVVGQGSFKYQLIPDWATENTDQFSLGHCHAIQEDPSGRILLLNASSEHCLIILSPDGKVLEAWGTFAPNAHGLAIVDEGERTFLFIADNSNGGKIHKTTLKGEILLTVSCPMQSGLYSSPNEFRPSKTLHLPNGDFFVIDGYGKDYIHRYDSEGTYKSSFGGDLGQGEARLEHFGPHGGGLDFLSAGEPTILLALSDRNKLKRFTLEGEWLETVFLPGSNPRDVLFHRGHLVIPHLGDDWPHDRNAAGYISILNRNLKVVANLGAESPRYNRNGKLDTMRHSSHIFHHPHGLCFDRNGALYVAQFASNGTWPLKFKRLP